jgi:hypothetical protein
MKRSFSNQLCVLTLLLGLGCASVLADDSEGLRPSWSAGQYQLPANSSILFSGQDPSFLSPKFGSHILGQKRTNELKDDYQSRNRDYDMRTSYGIATQNDEIIHQQAMKDMGRVVLFAAKNSQGQALGQNVAQSERNGDVSQPLIYVGAAASLGMGTPIDLKLGENSKATWHGDAMQRHGQIDLKSADMLATVEMSGQPSATERYKVSVNKPLVLSLNSSVMYGGTSNTVNASLSRPIVDRLSGSVGTTLPTGGNPTGAVAQETVTLSYGLRF